VPDHQLKELAMVNLCAPVAVEGCDYIPLVRKSLDLSCSLGILFLRKGDPGALVTQDGDPTRAHIRKANHQPIV
jgi:hypothetical protein